MKAEGTTAEALPVDEKAAFIWRSEERRRAEGQAAPSPALEQADGGGVGDPSSCSIKLHSATRMEPYLLAVGGGGISGVTEDEGIRWW